MKYWRIKVKREAAVGGGTHYVYPNDFHKTKKYFRIHYESVGEMDKVKARKNEEYEYVLVEAPDPESFTDIEGAEEIRPVEAEGLRKKWAPGKAEIPA